MAQLSIFEKQRHHSDKDITISIGKGDIIYVTFRNDSWKQFTGGYKIAVKVEGNYLRFGDPAKGFGGVSLVLKKNVRGNADTKEHTRYLQISGKSWSAFLDAARNMAGSHDLDHADKEAEPVGKTEQLDETVPSIENLMAGDRFTVKGIEMVCLDPNYMEGDEEGIFAIAAQLDPKEVPFAKDENSEHELADYTYSEVRKYLKKKYEKILKDVTIPHKCDLRTDNGYEQYPPVFDNVFILSIFEYFQYIDYIPEYDEWHRLRSASRGNSILTWSVGTSGGVTTNYAISALQCAPACIIRKSKKSATDASGAKKGEGESVKDDGLRVPPGMFLVHRVNSNGDIERLLLRRIDVKEIGELTDVTVSQHAIPLRSEIVCQEDGVVYRYRVTEPFIEVAEKINTWIGGFECSSNCTE